MQTIYAEVDALDQPFAAWTSPWSDAYVTVHHFADLATDATGNGHVVAPVAGTPTIEAGLIGAALGFVRANGDCAEIVDDPSLRPAQWSVSAWHLSHTPLVDVNYVVAVSRQEDTGFLDDFTVGVGPTDTIDTWYLRAVVFDGTTAFYYRDAALDSMRTEGGSSQNPIHVGCDQNTISLSEFFDGPVDELRFENVARPPAWLAADLASGRDAVITVGALAPP